MKACRGCGETKAIESFYVDSRSRDGRRTRCKKCVQKYSDRQYPELIKRRNENYDRAASARGECLDHLVNFGVRLAYHPELRAIFQWDHRYGKKSFELMFARFQMNSRRLEGELIKCALVCANCHALASQRNWHTEHPEVTRKRANHD